MNRLRLTAEWPSTARWALATCSFNSAQGAPSPVVAELVVGDPIGDTAGLLRSRCRPGLGKHQLVGHCFGRVFVAPFAHHIGQKRDPRAKNVGQAGGLQIDLIGFGDHFGVGDHGHVAEIVGGLEYVDDWQHGGGLGAVAFECFDRQRQAGGGGKQPNGDLWFQASLFGRTVGLHPPITASHAQPAPMPLLTAKSL